MELATFASKYSSGTVGIVNLLKRASNRAVKALFCHVEGLSILFMPCAVGKYFATLPPGENTPVCLIDAPC